MQTQEDTYLNIAMCQVLMSVSEHLDISERHQNGKYFTQSFVTTKFSFVVMLLYSLIFLYLDDIIHINKSGLSDTLVLIVLD